MPTVALFSSFLETQKIINEPSHGRSVGDTIVFSGANVEAVDVILSSTFPSLTPNKLSGRQFINEIVDDDNYKINIQYGITFSDQTFYDLTMEPAPIVGVRLKLPTSNPATYIDVIDESYTPGVGDRVEFTEQSYFNQGYTAYGITLQELYEPDLNSTYPVTEIIEGGYRVELGQAPISADSPGALTGGFIEQTGIEFLLPAGLNTSVLGPGWGSGTWSRATWNSAVQSLAGEGLRIWHCDNFGEDLIMNIRDFDNGIYYWDASSGLQSRAFPLKTYPEIRNAPEIATQVIVSEIDRHILCLGTNPIFETAQDPLLIRWSSQEDPSDWTPTATNTAGDVRLAQGSRIIVAQKTRRETLVFTDRALFSLQYVGPPYTFGTAQLADNVRIAGPNAVTAINDSVFWMGFENFFTYTGRVQPIPCSVRSYVFDDINREQLEKVYCATISSENEIWWFYPSANSSENDRYVTFNYVENLWTTGRLPRTAWIDGSSTLRKNPQATDPYGFLFNHEFGTVADKVSSLGQLTVDQPLGAYIESSYFDIGEGDKLMLATKVLPDLNMNASSTVQPETRMELQFVPYVNQADNFEDALLYLGYAIARDLQYINFESFRTPEQIIDRWESGLETYIFDPNIYVGYDIDEYMNCDFGQNANTSGQANIGQIGFDAIIGILYYVTGARRYENNSTPNYLKKMQYVIDRVLSNIQNITVQVQDFGGNSYQKGFFDGFLAFGQANNIAAIHRNLNTSNVSVDVTPYVGMENIRQRGRHMRVKYEVPEGETAVTIGDTRVEIREDGRR